MAGKSGDIVLPSHRHGAPAGQGGTSVVGTALTLSPRASASARASAAAAAAAAGDEAAAADGVREIHPAPPPQPGVPRDRAVLPRHPQLQRMRGGQEDWLVLWGIRVFSAISAFNTLAIGALLFSRAISRPPPCVSAAQPLRGSPQAGGQAAQQDLAREEAEEQAPKPKQRLHLSPEFLRQMERVTQRKIFRRNVTAGRRMHAINDAIIPIVPCPQKVRVHGPNGQPSFAVATFLLGLVLVQRQLFSSYPLWPCLCVLCMGPEQWLCMPQHLFGVQWPVGYSLTNTANYSYEVELHRRYGVQSTVFDRTLPLGRSMSAQFPFVATVGGEEAEALLHKILLQSGARREADPAAQLYSSASVLRSTCYACDYYFLIPAFGNSELASQAAPPAVGQIVVHLDRWNAPWDSSTRYFLQVMEKAGYYAFHTEQIFGSYRNKSYSVSLIHQAILFPHLLGKENNWLNPQRQSVS